MNWITLELKAYTIVVQFYLLQSLFIFHISKKNRNS